MEEGRKEGRNDGRKKRERETGRHEGKKTLRKEHRKERGKEKKQRIEGRNVLTVSQVRGTQETERHIRERRKLTSNRNECF